MVHLPPDPHILASFANANLPWWKALAELVDNSLDAGASRVVIDITNRVLTVSDDGLGCEDITAVFKLGEHKRRRSSAKPKPPPKTDTEHRSVEEFLLVWGKSNATGKRAIWLWLCDNYEGAT